MPIRFNHMELTVPVGMLEKEKDNLNAFYGEIFGCIGIEVPMVELDVPNKYLLSTDTEFSQFFFIAEDPKFLQPRSYDHIGFLMDNWEDVDRTHALVKEFQKRDPRVEIMHENSDFEAGPVFCHFYYFRYLLPIWIDVQFLQYKEGMIPQKQWRYA